MSKLLDLLNPYRWLILLALLAGLWGAHAWRVGAAEKRGYAAGDKAGAHRVQVQYDTFKGELITRSTTLLAEAYRVGGVMQGSFNQRTKELDDEITTVTRERDAALERLRNRPQRPAGGPPRDRNLPGDPTDQTAAPGCTGAQLYREDGHFLVGEAARGEVIRKGLLKCYADLDDARAQQAGFVAGHAAPPGAVASAPPP
ncbi:hypothetical protein FVQ98_14460 [Ottowia sp. GY511]|uniref:Lysis protein n=1 Tax=Ottowia flava TaxID=2675430 RepID=A0ABW4KML0_9BURK|nr:hypothetical protein [Ottowia sp. GY511]TXK26357.1 hypothetical protein FVQ98_14460 [Ottowia sp. GY511]